MAAAPNADPPDYEHAIGVLVLRLKLTRRQAEVLHWIAEGKTNGEIGTILDCSFFTVKSHTKEIFQRLCVHSRTAAAACAYRALIDQVAVPPLSPERAIPKKTRSR